MTRQNWSMRLLCVLCVSGVAISSACGADADKDPQGWNKVRFGMTEKEVADTMGDKIATLSKAEDYGDKQATLRIEDMEIAGSRYDVVFLFGKESKALQVAMMKFDGTPTAAECQTIVSLLTDKYGKPDLDAIKSNGRERETSWSFPTTQIKVTLIELPGLGPLMRVSYSPMVGKPKDPKDNL